MKKPTIIESSAIVGAVALSAFSVVGIYKFTQPSNLELCAEFATKTRSGSYDRFEESKDFLRRLGIYDEKRHFGWDADNDLRHYCKSLKLRYEARW